MKVAIAGATGFIGTRLSSFLKSKGHEVVRIVRKNAEVDDILWNPAVHEIDTQKLEGIDVIINLAGENIAGGRWSRRRKENILKSRVDATETLSKAVQRLSRPPQLFINTSAIGIYGNRGDEVLTESSPSGTGFLAEVCQQWEKAITYIPQTRVVILRFGAVLSAEGGMLEKMLIPFKMGLGGVIGTGEQYISWIDIDDLLAVFEYVINHNHLSGPYNAVSPAPVTNYDYTKALGKTLHRPTFFAMPAFVARLAFGEMADEMILSSQKALPAKLVSEGFVFKYPKIEESLEHLLS